MRACGASTCLPAAASSAAASELQFCPRAQRESSYLRRTLFARYLRCPQTSPCCWVPSPTNHMSVARSTTVERLRSRRKQASTASVPTPVPQHTRKLAELWSDAAAKMAPSDVDAAWARLLEETLPPEKREPLHRSYAAETDPSMRYNMLLEFSSYLRQVCPH